MPNERNKLGIEKVLWKIPEKRKTELNGDEVWANGIGSNCPFTHSSLDILWPELFYIHKYTNVRNVLILTIFPSTKPIISAHFIGLSNPISLSLSLCGHKTLHLTLSPLIPFINTIHPYFVPLHYFRCSFLFIPILFHFFQLSSLFLFYLFILLFFPFR